MLICRWIVVIACAGFTSLSVMANCTTCCADATANTLSEAEKKDGWRLLWDGKTTEGWRSIKEDKFPEKGWVITNGVLTVLSKKEAGQGGDLITREVFSNFIFKVDYRMNDYANSGVKYLYNRNLHGGTTMEYQIIEFKRPPKPSDTNFVARQKWMVAALYDLFPASDAQAKPLGEWNTVMIVCKGRLVEHWLNGKKVLEAERGSEAFRKAVAASKFAKHPNWGEQDSGHILLQYHNDNVSFRNIKIKELPSE